MVVTSFVQNVPYNGSVQFYNANSEITGKFLMAFNILWTDAKQCKYLNYF